MSAQNTRLSCAGLSILIIDDNRYLRDVVRTILELEGAVVFEAVTVREAQALFECVVPDGIVTDLELPSDRRGGRAILDHVKRRSLSCAVVLLTGRGDQYAELCDLGFDAVLLKPSTPTALILTIRDAVDRCRRTASREETNAA